MNIHPETVTEIISVGDALSFWGYFHESNRLHGVYVRMRMNVGDNNLPCQITQWHSVRWSSTHNC